MRKENGAEAGGNQVNATERRKTLRIRKEGGRSQSKERIKGDGYVFDDSRADSKSNPHPGSKVYISTNFKMQRTGIQREVFPK